MASQEKPIQVQHPDDSTHWNYPDGKFPTPESVVEDNIMTKVKIATARCARISYNTFEGKDDYEADIKLHDRLASSGHWSPFEHCARAMSNHEYEMWIGGNTGNYNPTTSTAIIPTAVKGVCGNFRGFIQYRKLFNNENRTDARVKKTFNLDASNTEQEQPAGGIQASV